MRARRKVIASIGWAIMTLATIVALGAIYLEFQAHEPIYTLMMKVCCVMIAVAGTLIGLSAAGGKVWE